MADNALGSSAAGVVGVRPGTPVEKAAAGAPASPTSAAAILARTASPTPAKAAPPPPARQVAHREDRSAKYADGPHAKPTKAPLQSRQGSPSGAGYTTSGIDAAMQRLADQTHKRVHRYGQRKK